MSWPRRTFRSVGLLLLLAGCGSGELTVQVTSTTTGVQQPTSSSTTDTATTVSSTNQSNAEIRTGADRLVASGFASIDGARVGLISHQNSLVDGRHLADLLDAAANVELVALFGPEHGARGDRDAGEYVEDAIDPSTGVPVFSLFGETRRPNDEMLRDLDVLLFDLQDVGARYYTYVSTMGLAMQAAAAADIEFIVLDRPNPLGGEVAGGVLDSAAASFVGMYPIPVTHGLTAGELALAIQANRWLDGVEALRLSVVEMTGWDASKRWQDTARAWIPPSPALTSADSALLYPVTVYLEATSLSYGRGTDRPFTRFGAPWLDATRVASELNQRMLPGLEFVPGTATPEMLPGMTVQPAFLGEELPVVNIDVTDHNAVQPADAAIHVLDVLRSETTLADVELISRPEWLDQLSGSERLRNDLVRGATAEEIVERQRMEVVLISKELEQHHLYARPA